MMKSLLVFNKKTLFLTLLIFVALLFGKAVLAEEATPSASVSASVSKSASASAAVAQKYHLTFPIAELGNCNNISECKEYCSKEENHKSCQSFAQKKNLPKKTEVHNLNPSLLSAAKDALGCDSEDSCRAVCEIEANRQKCKEFAKKNGLEKKHDLSGSEKKLMDSAKLYLGCDGADSCREFCQKTENKESCAEFAKRMGLGKDGKKLPDCQGDLADCPSGGLNQTGISSEKKIGPGGCTSEETCRTYCLSHKEECQKFAQSQIDSKGFKNSTASSAFLNSVNREEICQKYPEKCPRQSFSPTPIGSRTPEMEGATGVRGIKTSKTLFEMILGLFHL